MQRKVFRTIAVRSFTLVVVLAAACVPEAQ
jgi:hypothetical protein